MDKHIFILFSACGADETDITHYATVNKSKLLYSLFFVFTRLSQTFPFCGFILTSVQCSAESKAETNRAVAYQELHRKNVCHYQFTSDRLERPEMSNDIYHNVLKTDIQGIDEERVEINESEDDFRTRTDSNINRQQLLQRTGNGNISLLNNKKK